MIRVPDSWANRLITLLEAGGEEYAPLLKTIHNQQVAGGADLIDTVASILTSPKCKTIMTGTMLQTLRASILSPTEAARAAGMAKTHSGCSRCGVKLQDGEMCTMYDQSPVCVKCYAPEVHACGCGNKKLLGNSVVRILKKAYAECEACKAGVKVGANIVEEDDALFGGRPAAPVPTTAGQWVTATRTAEDMLLAARRREDGLAWERLRNAIPTAGWTTTADVNLNDTAAPTMIPWHETRDEDE
jgi:hypothetical protein